MKRILSILTISCLIVAGVAGCSQENTTSSGSSSNQTSSTSDNTSTTNTSASGFDLSHDITVVSRESGSGTRGAFVELTGIEEKDASGNKVDNTTDEAIIANGTDVAMTQVAGDEYAIAYISLGSLNDTVKALKIEGVEATSEEIAAGNYKIARPFNIATKGEPTGLAKDFIDFILSAEGQKIISDKYIMVDDNAPAYSGSKPSGKIVVAGSSSVTPIMEKLQEAYVKINPNATIEVQQSDSSTGMNSAKDGTCDIGMASRELKESELEELTPIQIAIDGIAVVVNNENSVDDITLDMVKGIYTGTITTWDQAK